MAKIALYQKYRSATFEEVVGQEYIVRSIKNAVQNHKVGHAYLFCGPRGTGKTTMARLLAKAVNCENPEKAPCGVCDNCVAANNGTHPDIIEINAANETHVEDIRDLIERSRLAPMQGKHKIYIIDEVHQLSSAASSALLKTLEEPPENVIFILATTDPQKLLPTIISRCQRYDFTKVRKDQIRDHLLNIAQKEDILLEFEAAELIAVLAEGGMRDALSIMDQCASYTGDQITVEAIDKIYGLTTTAEKKELIKDILSCNLESILNRIRQYEQRGIDLQRFTDGLLDAVKDTVVYANTHKTALLKVLTREEAEEIGSLADSKTCMHIADELISAKERFRFAQSMTTVFEVVCLKLATEYGKADNTVQSVKVQTPVIQPQPAKEVKPVIEPQQVQEIPSREMPEPEPIPLLIEEEAPLPETEPVKAPVVVEEVPESKPESSEISFNLLELLVQCRKDEKKMDEEAFDHVYSMMDLISRKYTSLLQDTKIGASGKDCLILICRNEPVAQRINDRKMNEEIYRFLKKRLELDKMVFAVTEQQFKDASRQFRTLMHSNQLPEACHIERYSDAVKKEATPEDKIKELFGAENVEII